MTQSLAPRQWAESWMVEGDVWFQIAAEGGGAPSLGRAQSAYDSAIEELTPAQPAEWVRVNANLATIWQMYFDQKPSILCLWTVLARLRNALDVLPRARDPLGWSRLRHSIGAALTGGFSSITDASAAPSCSSAPSNTSAYARWSRPSSSRSLAATSSTVRPRYSGCHPNRSPSTAPLLAARRTARA